MKKSKVLKIHPYKITEPQRTNLRWQTYIKDDKGGRQKISSTTEIGLYEKLYNHYFIKNNQTLEWLLPQWLENRRNEGISPRTVKRNENQWNKYYKNHKIATIPLTKITTEQIEKFLYECIKKYELTVKALYNMKFVLSDMLKYATKKKYISNNPFNDVDIKLNGCKPPTKNKESSSIYYHDEKEALFEVLEQDIENKPNNTESYAIFILFKLGLRIGELTALKWEDIDFTNKEIHIHRTESKTDTENGNLIVTVLNHTKKKSIYGDRLLPISDYEIALFKTIYNINSTNNFKDKDYVFCDKHGRITSSKIDSYIRRKCKEIHIEEKSAHDIRRTVASEMFNNGVPIEIIQKYLGHSDIKTTYGYIFNNARKEETINIIVNSLNNMNGLKRTQIA